MGAGMGAGTRASCARRVVAAVVGVVLGAIVSHGLTGCAATQGGSAALDRALGDYHAQRFSQAGEQADRVSAGRGGIVRGRAEYLAGLSAYKLGDHDEARRHLTAAVAILHGEEAARARAALGLVELARDRPAAAAEHFAAAWPGLTGEDARQAAVFAILAYDQAGDEAAAAEWTRSRHGRRSLSPPPGRGFTIQVGAFRERLRAERAAVDAAELTHTMGLTPVRIVTRTDRRGDVLYVVQLGSFETRTEASDVRHRVGRLQYIVAARTPG